MFCSFEKSVGIYFSFIKIEIFRKKIFFLFFKKQKFFFLVLKKYNLEKLRKKKPKNK